MPTDVTDGPVPADRKVRSAPEEFGNGEGEVDGLAPVQARVAHGLVAGAQIGVQDASTKNRLFTSACNATIARPDFDTTK